MIVGGGPSVDVALVRNLAGRARVIAVNDAYLLAPFADVCYFADFKWWEWHHFGRVHKKRIGLSAEDVKARFAGFAGQKCTIEPTGLSVADPAVFMLHKGEPQGLSESPRALATGSNSGYQSVNLAALAGAARALLYGFDMHILPVGPTHWFGDHPDGRGMDPRQYAGLFDTMVDGLKRMGTTVINCTPGSHLKAFPFSTLGAELS